MRLYEADREAFYLLACGGDSAEVASSFRPLAELAQRIRAAVRAGYHLVPASEVSGPAVQTSGGDSLPVPAELVPAVGHFLLDIDSKGTSATKGRDYDGRPVSEPEVRFKLGEPGERDQGEPGR
jgi:hypothetical protein